MGDDVRHGAYVCVTPVGGLAAVPIDELAARLGLEGEFSADGHPASAVAYLRRLGSADGHVADPGLAEAAAVLHVASADPAIVSTFCTEAESLLSGLARLQNLHGTVQPTRYTGGAMHEFAYARQRTQEPAESMPNAFLLPLQKLPEWWAKDWMERHTYFLPRYDADGRMVTEGHALAASAGVPALMRRTYRCAEEAGYDFLTYFECADADVPVFQRVCAALRDVRRNPEWAFVREGPTWRGRRMPSWSSLWTASGTAPTRPAR
jgi:hypothetical protein